MFMEAGIDGMACRYALHADDVFQNRTLNRFGSRKNGGINYLARGKSSISTLSNPLFTEE